MMNRESLRCAQVILAEGTSQLLEYFDLEPGALLQDLEDGGTFL